MLPSLKLAIGREVGRPGLGARSPSCSGTDLPGSPHQCFRSCGLGGCAPGSSHTAGLGPSSCVHPGMTRLLRAVGSALGQERFVLLTHFVKVAMKWPWRGSPGFQ